MSAASIFRDDRGWQIAWPAAIAGAVLFHCFAFAVASKQEAKPKPPPIVMAIVEPPPPQIENPEPPPPPPPPEEKPKPPPPKKAEVSPEPPPPPPKVEDTPPPPEPPQEVPLQTVPVELGPQTGEGVKVAMGSPDGTAGAKPVSGDGPAQPTTNIVAPGPRTIFNARGYREGAIALVNKQKRYPRKARVLGLQGKCVVKVRIDHDGEIVGAPVLVGRGSGHDVLDEEALRMVRAAAPFPSIPEGVETPYELFFPIHFSLQDAP